MHFDCNACSIDVCVQHNNAMISIYSHILMFNIACRTVEQQQQQQINNAHMPHALTIRICKLNRWRNKFNGHKEHHRQTAMAMNKHVRVIVDVFVTFCHLWIDDVHEWEHWKHTKPNTH